jgi:hypothetical protein
MGKAKIGFEVDEDDLAKAKAYVARHGGSLNKLVSALFASLGRDDPAEPMALDPTVKTLLATSMGKISLMEAAQQLDLPDAGYVLHLLAEKNLPLPRLPQSFVAQQLEVARSALDECLIEAAPTAPKRRSGRKNSTAATS